MSPWVKARKQMRRHNSGMIGIVIVVILMSLAALASVLAPFDPVAQNPDLKFIPPIWDEKGVWPHLLGTDVLGRDLFSRILYGARLSLIIGTISVFVGCLIGIPIGLVSGFWGGHVDTIMMRFVDVMLAFPSLLLAVCIVAILGPSLENAMIAIGLVEVPKYARIVRASVLSEKEKEYVIADIAMGRKKLVILFKGIFPNILSPILVVATLGFATAVLEAAGLSFLGLGAQPPTPEWGALLLEGKQYIYQAWWLIMFPGIAILFTVIGFNLFGDALRDVTDPRSLK